MLPRTIKCHLLYLRVIFTVYTTIDQNGFIIVLTAGSFGINASTDI